MHGKSSSASHNETLHKLVKKKKERNIVELNLPNVKICFGEKIVYFCSQMILKGVMHRKFQSPSKLIIVCRE
jgi:hypothetical protein